MRCELIIRGNVQDTGYRKFVEGHAEMKRLRGLSSMMKLKTTGLMLSAMAPFRRLMILLE
ncbi:MAG: hypothetical protein MSIBF_01795 [Candidatus Altiarchaeales archaeon IMC4]|nr:MAG: hypothetical protein MSIBF_01795 [Candidatus Altiarchaeales archaeon IMC4]